MGREQETLNTSAKPPKHGPVSLALGGAEHAAVAGVQWYCSSQEAKLRSPQGSLERPCEFPLVAIQSGKEPAC